MLLDGGAGVLVTGRSRAGLDSAQKELGEGALVVASDVRSLSDIDALASGVKSEFDTFDLLFVNAGFSIRAPFESMTAAVYDEMFNLNAKGPLFAVQKLAPQINRRGSVVFTTSIANVKGMPGQAAYGATKAATILRSDARRRAAFSRNSRQRGDTRPHRHADVQRREHSFGQTDAIPVNGQGGSHQEAGCEGGVQASCEERGTTSKERSMANET